MSSFDTGDIVIHTPTHDVHIVACVHDPYLHTAGFPEKRLMIQDCMMKEPCSDSERRNILRRMAESSGKSHRPSCARERLGREQATAEFSYDYCD